MSETPTFFVRNKNKNVSSAKRSSGFTKRCRNSTLTPQIHNSQNYMNNENEIHSEKRFTTPSMRRFNSNRDVFLHMDEFSSYEEEASFQSSSSSNEFEYGIQMLRSQIANADKKIQSLQKSSSENDAEFERQLRHKQMILQQLTDQIRLTEDDRKTEIFKEYNDQIKDLEAQIKAQSEVLSVLDSSELKYNKYLEDFKYINSICESDTQEVFDIASKMIQLKISFPIDKQNKINAELESEFNKLIQEKSIFDAIIPSLKNDNDSLEKEIEDIKEKINAIEMQNQINEKNQNIWKKSDCRLSEDLLRAKSLLKQESKARIQKEKKYFTEQVKQHVTDNKTMKLNVQWKTQDGKLLQDQIEQLNYEISNYIDESDKKIDRLKASIQDLKDRQMFSAKSNSMQIQTPQPFKKKNSLFRHQSTPISVAHNQ